MSIGSILNSDHDYPGQYDNSNAVKTKKIIVYSARYNKIQHGQTNVILLLTL